MLVTFCIIPMCSVVHARWNVMAHAQKSDFFFRRNGRVHLNRRRRQFSRLLAAEVCTSAVVMLDTPCSEVLWRVLATHCIRQFPLHFPPVRHRVPSHFNCSLQDVVRHSLGFIWVVTTQLRLADRSLCEPANTILHTGLFEMIVGLLTTCHIQYTWDSSICILGSVSSPMCVWKLERVCSQIQLCQLRCI